MLVICRVIHCAEKNRNISANQETALPACALQHHDNVAAFYAGWPSTEIPQHGMDQHFNPADCSVGFVLSITWHNNITCIM